MNDARFNRTPAFMRRASEISKSEPTVNVSVEPCVVVQKPIQSEEDVWLKAWMAVAAAENCIDIALPEKWADACVKAFNLRYRRQS